MLNNIKKDFYLNEASTDLNNAIESIKYIKNILKTQKLENWEKKEYVCVLGKSILDKKNAIEKLKAIIKLDYKEK